MGSTHRIRDIGYEYGIFYRAPPFPIPDINDNDTIFPFDDRETARAVLAAIEEAR